MPLRPALAVSGAVLTLAGFILWFLHIQLELPLAAALHLDAGNARLPAIVVVTGLGGAAIMIPAALAAALFLAIRGRAAHAIWLVATIASGRLLVELLKLAIGRARPDLAGHLVPVSSASFPSSHSAGTMLTIVALMLAFRARPWLAAIALAWPLLIGATRVMLGVHWPSDVLAGWGLALLWIALASRWLPKPAPLGPPPTR